MTKETTKETVVALAQFKNLENFEKFIYPTNPYGFVEVEIEGKGLKTAYLSKAVFLRSGFKLTELWPDTTFEVMVVDNPLHQRYGVTRVLGLYQPEAALPQPQVEVVAEKSVVSAEPRRYPVAQFRDLRPATTTTKCYNAKTGQKLMGVHNSQGELIYFVVVKDGEDMVERIVHSTELATGLKAIGKRPSAPKVTKVEDAGRVATEATTAPANVTAPAPKKSLRTNKPKAPTSAATNDSGKPKLGRFSDFAQAMQALKGQGQGSNTTH